MHHVTSRSVRLHVLVFASACGMLAAPLSGLAQAPAVPRQSGTVKAVNAHDFVLTASGGDYTVTVPEAAHVFIVPPGSTSLSSAAPGAMSDVQPGDRALITGSAGDSGMSLTATRVVLMKSTAIAAVHAAQSSAWAQGAGGIVKSVNGATVNISSGLRSISVDTTPSTIVRRYAPGSIKFDEATSSSVAAIQPGDQLRVRGAKSADGSAVTADEIVTGSFKNYSGTLQSIDASAGTVTLKDLATKREVTVTVAPSSDLRRLPPAMAQMVAGRMRGGAASGSAGGSAAGAAPGAGAGAGTEARAGAAGPASAGGRRAGSDLSSMLSRMPTETLGGLKQGDAVMIVATAPSASDSGKPIAITLLAGVEPILAAPAGESTTLSPWSVGGGEPEAPGGGAPGGPGGGGR